MFFLLSSELFSSNFYIIDYQVYNADYIKLFTVCIICYFVFFIYFVKRKKDPKTPNFDTLVASYTLLFKIVRHFQKLF